MKFFANIMSSLKRGSEIKTEKHVIREALDEK